jgi:serine/threonine protein kinase
LPHWQCPFCEEQVEDYATMESMGSHIQSKHELELLETPLSTILSWSAVQKMGITHCPLCSSQGPEDSPELVDHILWHAYDFALRALPWPFPVSHDLNSPPGEFNFPEDTARATNLQSWIDGKIIYESREQLELELSQYDRANHCPSVPVDVSGYSGYFQRNPYFDDSPDDRSSKPQGNQSKPSHHSNAYFEEPIEESERPLHNSKVTIKGIREGAEDHLMSEDEPSNASGYVVQHPDDMVEGEDLEQQLGACFAGYTSTEQPHLQETDIRKIADILLRHSKMSWSKIPRIYSILRIIGHLEYIELFVKQGLTDYCVPFLKSCLPSQMAPQHKAAFFQAQQLVFNSNLIIASEAAVHHCHFQDEDEVPLESVGHLGQGFRSQVDQVRSFITGKDFARKRLNRTTKRFTESQQSFEAELAIRKRISEKHTHLPIFCNSYTLPYETAILMSPIADYRLDEYLRQDRENVQEEILWTLFGCLSSTLHFLHISFIWHKDVKPHNVLLKKEKIVLVGFGHALDWSELEDDQESGPPDAMTRRYAAPEVISHEERSSLTDVWSLGCIFLEIWTVLNGKSLGDMKSYLESGTDNLSCYADNLDRIDLWITHIQELSDNKVDKAPAEWIRNMLTPDQHARWSARTLFDAINQHGGRYIGECCRVRGNTQETSETYDTAESDPVSQERVWTDLDQEREDNLAESEPPDTEQIASASHSVPQKHSSLPQHTLYQTSSRPPSYTSLNEIDPGVTDVVPSPSTVQQQSKPSSPAIPDTESKVGSPLSLKVTTEPTTGRSSVRRWLDRAGAYIGTKEPVKKSYRYPMVPGEDLRNEDLQRTAEQYESLRRQRTRSPAPSIRSLEQPKSEGLLTPMPLPEQDDEERLRREHLARQAKERDRVRRNREEAELMEAEWQMKLGDELRRERDELRNKLDPRPRDGS